MRVEIDGPVLWILEDAIRARLRALAAGARPALDLEDASLRRGLNQVTSAIQEQVRHCFASNGAKWEIHAAAVSSGLACPACGDRLSPRERPPPR